VEKVKPKEQSFSAYRGVRSLKHKGDKHYQDGLRKSSSLHDLSSDDVGLDLASSRYLSKSGDRSLSFDEYTLLTLLRSLPPSAALECGVNRSKPDNEARLLFSGARDN
jgi:hypothetical protein